MSNWNAPPPTYDAHSTTTSYITTTLTPYLQLPHLLSLTWLAYPILSLVFVAFRLQLSLADAKNAVASAKDDLVASCKAAEEAATSAASMPRYMALATNKQFAEAVNGSMNAARATLVLSLTVMEAVINFIVDLYRSTLLCFLELVVRGGLAILIGAVQEINQVLQTVANGLRTSIQSDIASANNVISSAINGINKVNPFGDIKAPQIAVPSLDGLQNIQLPPTIEDALTKLNASLPSVSDIKDKVESIIDTPFELLKKDINDTFAGITFHPDGLPVPAQNRLTFCNDMDLTVVDDIGRDFVKTAKIGVVILILLALVLVGLNCLLTWYKWRCMKKHLEYTRQAWMTDPTLVHPKSSVSAPQITLSDHNLLMLQANSEHPLITRITNQISARFRLSPTQHTHMQWFFNYIFHAPALACFLIGFFGLLSVQIQLIAMGPLVAKYQSRAASSVSDFSTRIATDINASMYNQSALYATEVNGRVDAIQSSINNGVFGWVNVTTTTLNNTVNEFYTDVQNAVATVFNGTILESPANEFIKCFIGGKVDAIENALTFLHDNLHVDMPRVNDTVLILSPDSVDEATRPIAAAAIGGGQGDDQGLIGRLVNSYAASLKKERVMFGIFMALWGVVVLMGLSVVLWHSFGKAYLEKRKRRKYEVEQRGGIHDATLSSPYEGGDMLEVGGKEGVMRSFSPLPSPKRRSAFKPFWLNGKKEEEEEPSSTKENDRPWETAFARPQSQTLQRNKTAKLLALGRKAFTKEPRLQKQEAEDGEEIQVPLTPAAISEPVSPHHRDTAWYDKMTGLLVRKKKEGNRESADFWDPSAAVPVEDQPQAPKPKLQIYTQRGLDKYGPPPKHPQVFTQEELDQQAAARSRFSTSPAATQTSWKNILSPTKRQQLQPPLMPTPATPATAIERNDFAPFPHPPIGVPIVKDRQPTNDIPLDVGPMYEDPFMSPRSPPSVLPVPLHNGFESQAPSRTFPSLPRHPRRQDSGSEHASPPPMTSPTMMQPQTALAPPPMHVQQPYSRYPLPYRPPKSAERHRKSVSFGGLSYDSPSRSNTTTSQWRVTNAVKGDPAYTSSASSLVPSINIQEDNSVSTPVTRYLTATHARQSSTLNPFITPFDDEHRVHIDHPSAEGLRKSMQTQPSDPFAMAI